MYHRAEDMQREQGLRLEVSQLKAENAKLRVERDEWKRVAESKAAVRPDVGAGDRGRRMIDLEVEAIRRKITRLEGLKAERLCDDNDQLKAENAKLRELACHLWYVKPRDVTSVLVEGKLVDLEELMESVGLRWEDA